VILFEMLVGHVPFSGNNIVHLKSVIESNEAFLPFDMRAALSPACQVRRGPSGTAVRFASCVPTCAPSRPPPTRYCAAFPSLGGKSRVPCAICVCACACHDVRVRTG
jgi:hypothetical protein